jgi:hypothetical protein
MGNLLSCYSKDWMSRVLFQSMPNENISFQAAAFFWCAKLESGNICQKTNTVLLFELADWLLLQF